MSNEKSLRSQVIRLAHEHPEFRKDLLPLVATKQASDLTPVVVKEKLAHVAKELDGIERVLVDLVRRANSNGFSGSELRGLLEKLQDFRGEVGQTSETLWTGDYPGFW